MTPKTMEELLEEHRQFASSLLDRPDPEPAPDPSLVCRKAEGVEGELHAAAELDNTPGLLLVPESAGVPWAQLLLQLTDRLRAVMVKPGAKRMVKPVLPEQAVGPAIEYAEGIRRKVAEVIDGNRANKVQSAALRADILGGRVVPHTRMALEDEMKTIVAAIQAQVPEAPVALRALVPLVEEAQGRLDAARSAAGRPRTGQVQWSRPVEEWAVALNLVLGEFLSWAVVKASDKRLGAFKRIITPKRRNDSAEAAPAPEPAAAPPPPASAGQSVREPGE